MNWSGFFQLEILFAGLMGTIFLSTGIGRTRKGRTIGISWVICAFLAGMIFVLRAGESFGWLPEVSSMALTIDIAIHLVVAVLLYLWLHHQNHSNREDI